MTSERRMVANLTDDLKSLLHDHGPFSEQDQIIAEAFFWGAVNATIDRLRAHQEQRHEDNIPVRMVPGATGFRN